MSAMLTYPSPVEYVQLIPTVDTVYFPTEVFASGTWSRLHFNSTGSLGFPDLLWFWGKAVLFSIIRGDLFTQSIPKNMDHHSESKLPQKCFTFEHKWPFGMDQNSFIVIIRISMFSNRILHMNNINRYINKHFIFFK